MSADRTKKTCTIARYARYLAALEKCHFSYPPNYRAYRVIVHLNLTLTTTYHHRNVQESFAFP